MKLASLMKVSIDNIPSICVYLKTIIYCMYFRHWSKTLEDEAKQNKRRIQIYIPLRFKQTQIHCIGGVIIWATNKEQCVNINLHL